MAVLGAQERRDEFPPGGKELKVRRRWAPEGRQSKVGEMPTFHDI